MRRLHAIFLALLAASAARAQDAPTPAADPAPSSVASPVQSDVPRSGILQLLDGSMLHGALGGIAKESGLTWLHEAAAGPLRFSEANLSLVRFERAQPAPSNLTPSCRFHFKNGDELIGNLLGMEDGKLRFETWFGADVSAEAASLEGILFSAKGYRLLYEGPDSAEGWKIGRNSRSWEYRDGAFIANGADLLGRDFGLTGSSTLEFDLGWNGPFSLSITLYAQAIDRFDYSTSAYLIYLGTGAISVQRVQAGSGAIMLGQTQLPEMLRRNKMRFELRCNKEDATISLFADGKFIQRWKDNNQGGFVAKGGGIVFFSQVEPRSLTLSNIRVAEWDGRYEPDLQANAPADQDVVFLANRDKVFGKIVSVSEAKATIETKQAKLDIPLARVTQVRFAQNAEAAAGAAGQVRASFPGGESIAFQLENWDAAQVRGTSTTFGSLAFDPKTIRQLQFNLNRAAPAPKEESNLDLEFLGTE